MAIATTADHALARDLATRAGELLLELRVGLDHGRDPAEVRAEGDSLSHVFLMDELARARPDDGVLSEEGAADPGRLTMQRVWIVDPLDGTREFGEAGRSDWAVHVALVIDGVPVAGAVALAALGVTLATDNPPSTPPPRDGRPRLVVSRSRPPALAASVAGALDGDLAPLGSAGAKAMAVVRGEADVYVHSGGQYEWDSAAPVAVALAAGVHCSRLDGSPLVYNRENPWLPDLVICRADLAEATLAAVAAAAATPA